MRNPETTSVGINKTHYFSDGAKVTAVFADATINRRKTPGETAFHEAEHAVAAEINGTAVKRVTTVPGPGYLGLTELSRFDPIAAAAPHANARSGTSHDMSLLVFSGSDSHAAVQAAQRIISERKVHIFEVASTLEEKRTIGRSEVLSAMEIAELGREVIVFLEYPDGKKSQFSEVRTKDGLIPVEREWFEDKK